MLAGESERWVRSVCVHACNQCVLMQRDTVLCLPGCNILICA